MASGQDKHQNELVRAFNELAKMSDKFSQSTRRVLQHIADAVRTELNGDADRHKSEFVRAFNELAQMDDKFSESTRGVLQHIADTVQNEAEEDVSSFEKDVGVEYAYSYDTIPPLAMLKGFPWKDFPRIEWMIKTLIVGCQIIHNSLLVRSKVASTPAAITESEMNHLEIELGKWTSLLSGLDGFKTLAALLRVMHSTTSDEPLGNSLEKYNNLYRAIKLPEIAHTFRSDASFAHLRVAGPNPTSLCRVTPELFDKFPVTNELYQKVMGTANTLEDALRLRLLYVVDYAGQSPILDGAYPSDQKYGFEPIALFAVPPSGELRTLVPVAIQCGQDPDAYPIFTPSDDDAWLFAKSVVQAADGTYHELVAHLGRTHLLLEPFAVGTCVDLQEEHPLRKLLEPHFEGTLFINWAAAEFLVAPRNFVDRILTGTIDSDRTTSAKITMQRGFNESFLPRWLEAQGVLDRESLPVYPFRDDGLLLWRAIGDWTKSYVNIFWHSDEAVQSDQHLQTWADNMAAFEGGRVAGFGEIHPSKKRIATRTYLAEVAQMVIWTASGMHAAVNFPQGDVENYAPAVPLAGYRPAPTQGMTEEDWLNFLPPVNQAQSQLNILYLLGNVYFTRLGEYNSGHFTNSKVEEALRDFQAALDEVTRKIERANESRPSYTYLLPKKIPQSINI